MSFSKDKSSVTVKLVEQSWQNASTLPLNSSLNFKLMNRLDMESFSRSSDDVESRTIAGSKIYYVWRMVSRFTW